MTNLERIQKMNVDEMARILFSSCTEHICCEFKPETCQQCVTNWLNSECEVIE